MKIEDRYNMDMLRTRLDRASKQVDQGLRDISDLLQGTARDIVMVLSLLHPGKTFLFCSAMGTYDISWREADNYKKVICYYKKHPFIKIMDEVQHNYGWEAIPAPVRMIAKDGQVEVQYDW